MNENSLTVSGSSVLASMPTQTLSDFQAQVFDLVPNQLVRASLNDGNTDILFHVGQQLRSEDVVNHILTIIRVAFASITRMKDGQPVTNESGEIIVDRYPVCHFSEAPGFWYNGGSMLKKNIESWAKEVGDDMSDPYLPRVNAVLSEVGGVRAFFAWKNKQDNSGQRYVNIILA